jgi:hypothetical protein
MYSSKESKYWDDLIKEADLDGDGEVTNNMRNYNVID